MLTSLKSEYVSELTIYYSYYWQTYFGFPCGKWGNNTSNDHGYIIFNEEYSVNKKTKKKKKSEGLFSSQENKWLDNIRWLFLKYSLEQVLY